MKPCTSCNQVKTLKKELKNWQKNINLFSYLMNVFPDSDLEWVERKITLGYILI